MHAKTKIRLHLTFVNIDSFCLLRTRLIVHWRHLVITFSVEEFSSISQIKGFLL